MPTIYNRADEQATNTQKLVSFSLFFQIIFSPISSSFPFITRPARRAANISIMKCDTNNVHCATDLDYDDHDHDDGADDDHDNDDDDDGDDNANISIMKCDTTMYILRRILH